MPLQSFALSVILRTLLLLATLTGLSLMFGRAELFFSQLILAVLVSVQVYSLLRYARRTNRELARFLLAIKNTDFSVHFPQGKDRIFRELHSAFREITDVYRTIKAEKEAQYEHLRLIVRHIRAGVISVKGYEEIMLINQPAMDMLGIGQYHYWRNLKMKYPQFVREIEQLREGESRLVDITVNGEHKRFSVHASTLILLQQPYTIISFQDIEEEISQSELDAWHKLIRILTHEMMNSVTPIASLSETLLMLVQNQKGRLGDTDTLQASFMEELAFSLQTIQKRSDGLLHFLDNYRKLTRIPAPQLEVFSVRLLLEHVKQLMAGEIKKRNVRVEIHVVPENLMLFADPTQVEQVLINLVTNSIQAMESTAQPMLTLSAWQQKGKTIVEVRDNGPGIDEDKLDQIFVPFFSTRENGSGIGLSLARHILSLHGGSIRVNSQKNEHTSFYLSFPRAKSETGM